MRIGYSMWGFLGAGIADTPDGSRAYRRPFIDGLIAAGHACDLHRQTDLFDYYTKSGTPTLIWDLDRQLPGNDPRRLLANVKVGEFALTPTPGAVSLPCPVPDALLDTADPKPLVSLSRPLPLIYVGNQYDRDDAFDRYFAPAAARVPHQVAGKWIQTQRWPHVRFIGRCRFKQVETFHRRSLATVLLLPDRYADAGHMTSRWFEAPLAGCLPLIPAEIRFVDAYAPSDLQVITGQDVIDKLSWIQSIAGSAEHADLIAGCLPLLEPFRCSTQVAAALTVLEGLS